MAKKEDDLYLSILGKFGVFQLRTILIIYLVKIPSAWFMACIIFTAPQIWPGEMFCNSGLNSIDTSISNSSHLKELDLCSTYKEVDCTYNKYDSSCNHLNKTVALVPCESFEVSPHSEYVSIITEFSLVCSKKLLPAITQFFHLFGVLWGGIIATHMLKTISPRNVMLIGMITQIISGNLCAFSSTVYLHMFFRCTSAICCGFMYTAGGMIFSDITGGVYRVSAICLFEQFWSVGIILLPVLAHFCDSWTELYIAISCPSFLLLILYKWIPDSPRWLVNHKRISEAAKILESGAESNGKPSIYSHDELKFKLKELSEQAENAPKEPSFWEMWEGEGVKKNLIFCHLAWSIYIIIYYGFLLNIRPFGRQYLEVNTAICGIFEIIGTFVGWFLIVHTTKKWLWTGLLNLIASGIALTAHFIPDFITGVPRVVLLMIFSMPSKVAISSTLSILTTCSVELVAPPKRRMCAYSTVVYARIFLLLLPFVMSTDMFGELAAQTFIACMNLAASLFTIAITCPRTLPKKQKLQSQEIFNVSNGH